MCFIADDVPKNVVRMVSSVDRDQTARSSLIRVCPVCLGTSVPLLELLWYRIHKSLLKSLQLVNSDITINTELPPVTFGFQEKTFSRRYSAEIAFSFWCNLHVQGSCKLKIYIWCVMGKGALRRGKIQLTLKFLGSPVTKLSKPLSCWDPKLIKDKKRKKYSKIIANLKQVL